MSRSSRIRSVALGLFLLGCSPEGPEPAVLELVQVRPRVGEDVLLNEPLVFHFSGEVDRASITPGSVRIVSEGGDPARGRLLVRGREVRFVPEPVLSPELDDGGYRVSSRYEVEIAGFPRPDTVRSLGGAPLRRTVRHRFQTVGPGDSGGEFLFLDDTPEVARPLRLSAYVIDPTSPLTFEAGEPLDPATIRSEDFVFCKVVTDDKGRPERDEAGSWITLDPIALRGALVDNRGRGSGPTFGRTTLELHPSYSPLEPGLYLLRIDLSTLSLRDFAGNRPLILGHPPTQETPITVRDLPTRNRIESHFEPFFPPSARTPVRVPGADGTAYWSDSGQVTVRYPRAAGDGSDGAVRLLTGTEVRGDLQSERLHVPAGQVCTLSSRAGTVVLRAQGTLRVDGRLVRRPPESQGRIPKQSPVPTLSQWLEDARHDEGSWTVLIAGGDLVVTGEVDVSGPLLLVAGGRIRISGRVEGSEDVYKLREGGGGGFAGSDAPLILDPPRKNPLRETLTYSVLSAPLPARGGARRWSPGVRIGAHAGQDGAVRVRFLPVPLGGSSEPDFSRAVDDPSELPDASSILVWIELEVRPGADWDPPWVDFIEFTWERLHPAVPR